MTKPRELSNLCCNYCGSPIDAPQAYEEMKSAYDAVVKAHDETTNARIVVDLVRILDLLQVLFVQVECAAGVVTDRDDTVVVLICLDPGLHALEASRHAVLSVCLHLGELVL